MDTECFRNIATATYECKCYLQAHNIYLYTHHRFNVFYYLKFQQFKNT
jgi:hypothetical protein